MSLSRTSPDENTIKTVGPAPQVVTYDLMLQWRVSPKKLCGFGDRFCTDAAGG